MAGCVTARGRGGGNGEAVAGGNGEAVDRLAELMRDGKAEFRQIWIGKKNSRMLIRSLGADLFPSPTCHNTRPKVFAETTVRRLRLPQISIL